MSSTIHAKLDLSCWWSAPHIEVDIVETRLDWPIEEAITMVKDDDLEFSMMLKIDLD